jgi:hypothetical protein
VKSQTADKLAGKNTLWYWCNRIQWFIFDLLEKHDAQNQLADGESEHLE